MIGPLWVWGRDMPECARVAFAGVQIFVENRWPQTSLKCQKWTRYWFRYGTSQAKCIAFYSWPSIRYFQSIGPINIFYTNNHNDTTKDTHPQVTRPLYTCQTENVILRPVGDPRPSIWQTPRDHCIAWHFLSLFSMSCPNWVPEERSSRTLDWRRTGCSHFCTVWLVWGEPFWWTYKLSETKLYL